MTPDSFQAYLARLQDIRAGLTDTKRIKFIDDILSALSYKDAVIDNIQADRSKLIESNMQLRIERDRYLKQRNFYHSILDKLQLSLVINNDADQDK